MRRAAPIVLGAALIHYGWALFPADMQARVWNIAGAGGRMALLAVVVLACLGFSAIYELIEWGAAVAIVANQPVTRPPSTSCSAAAPPL